MFDIRKIIEFIGDTLYSTLGLKNIYILSTAGIGDYEVVYCMSSSGGDKQGIQQIANSPSPNPDSHKRPLRISMDSEIVSLLNTSNDVLIKDELPAIVDVLGEETINNITKTIETFNGKVLVPVFIDDKLSIVIILGEKLSGDLFTQEDVNLLGTISNQISIAVKNARLYAEKLSSEKFASMGLMSATFAHEIRNPLTSIKTFVQLMPEKFGDEEFRNFFTRMVSDDIDRIDGLIKDLLNFSDAKSRPLKEKFNFITLMDEVLNYVDGKLNLMGKNISVEKIYKSVKINILGEQKQLKQAFINIVTNSCQAIGENGVLTIDVTPDKESLEVRITDTGPGIPIDEINKIFDPFYTTKPMGIGLGLAISKKIIENHNGIIRVESLLGEGTTFIVSLPIDI
jgi:signal transduction histidine kinase